MIFTTTRLDCKHAVRTFSQTPSASLVAILVLAVGIAFVGAFLSLYVDLVLRPHPGFEQSERLATFGYSNGPNAHVGLPYGALDRIADEMTSIETAAMVFRDPYTLVGPDSERTVTEFASEGFFGGLRPRLALGRGFLPEEHTSDAEPVVVLSYRYWQQQFDGDPNVLGTSLLISRDPGRRYMGPNLFPTRPPERDSAQFRIVGVLADSLSGGSFADPAVWVPVESAFLRFEGVSEALQRVAERTYVRRHAGVSVQTMLDEFDARYSGEDALFELPSGASIDAIDGIVSNFALHRDTKRQLQLFLVASFLLAFVAAVNVSLFLLARAPGRRREIGIRLAVGAPMHRIVRQLATESGLLVIFATGLGLFMSFWIASGLRGLSLMREAEWRNVTLIDWRVLGAAAAIVLLLTLIVSLAPILCFQNRGIGALSHHATTRASLAQRLAGTVQVAAAGAIGGAAIAFTWHLGLLMFGDPGYELQERYQVFMPVTTDANVSRERQAIEAIPGVTAVAYGRPSPATRDALPRAVIAHADDSTRTIDAYIGWGEQQYVDLLRLKVLHGAVPSSSRDTPYVLVNETLARAVWGRADVIGEIIPPGSLLGDGAEVVAVLEDVSFNHPAETVPPIAWRVGASPGFAIIEARLTASKLKQELDRIAEIGEIEVSASLVQPLQVLYNELTAQDRARGFLTMAAATLIVILAAFGFYGIQRYLVVAGRREYAIRTAIGAGPKAIGRLVVQRGVLLGLPGLLAGGLLGFIVVAWLRDDFVMRVVSPVVVTLWLVAALISLLIAASVGPARDAQRGQPALLREG